jgi:hypothetical protein
MAAAVGIPPIGHKYSRTFLIHWFLLQWRWLATNWSLQ